ncbi:MAG: hypothetical protein AAGB12_08225 [Pseudomonadota bacterium]
MKLISLSICMLGLALMTGSTQADSKNYNASSCVQFVGDGKILNFSNIFNDSSTTTMNVDCVATKSTNQLKSAWIEVKDLSSTEDISCNLISHYNGIGQSGGFIWNQTQKTSGINSNWQVLNYTSLPASDNGHYFLSCSVPKKTSNGASWLGTYRITE